MPQILTFVRCPKSKATSFFFFLFFFKQKTAYEIVVSDWSSDVCSSDLLSLCCCPWAFSSCGKQGLLCCGAWASHFSGFSCCGARALGVQASVVVAHRLSSCASWTLECRLSSCGAQA